MNLARLIRATARLCRTAKFDFVFSSFFVLLCDLNFELILRDKVESRILQGMTALMWSAHNGRVETVKALLDANADPSKTSVNFKLLI